MLIAVSVGAFYLLLPQLADVGDSFTALRSANFGWLAVCVVMSLLTYVASAIGLQGGVPGPLPFVANVGSAAASSFVNRVTPANVGGMALNVRFMQKAGIDPAQAVTGMGLNVLAGAIVHAVLLFVFVAWAGQSSTGFKIPASSKLLVIIAVVLAIVGIVVATRRGRRLIRTHVLRFLKQSWSSLVVLSRSPLKLVMLFGGSSGVTLAYIAALSAAVAAYGGGLTFAQVGAVYLGASVVAAAAPTPGGLGAMEAALVAGLTGVGMDSGEAVAAVLSYRLATYWLPILPGLDQLPRPRTSQLHLGGEAPRLRSCAPAPDRARDRRGRLLRRIPGRRRQHCRDTAVGSGPHRADQRCARMVRRGAVAAHADGQSLRTDRDRDRRGVRVRVAPGARRRRERSRRVVPRGNSSRTSCRVVGRWSSSRRSTFARARAPASDSSRVTPPLRSRSRRRCCRCYRGADGSSCTLAATMVGVSRIVYGVHFPLDVVGGAALGIMCGCVVDLAMLAIPSRDDVACASVRARRDHWLPRLTRRLR